MEYLVATSLLSIERLTYGFLWKKPQDFAKVASFFGFEKQEPEFIFNLVKLFKVVQTYVFATWYYERYGFSLPECDPWQVVLGVILLGFGQFLNTMVWYRIGVNGVCYGCKFGRHIPWCTEFPYNTFSHPQYLGTILTVWGMFVFCFKEAQDWFFLPAVETLLYMCSMYSWEA